MSEDTGLEDREISEVIFHFNQYLLSESMKQLA